MKPFLNPILYLMYTIVWVTNYCFPYYQVGLGYKLLLPHIM